MTTFLDVLVFALVVAPLLTLGHELGHALLALLLASGPVTVTLGRQAGQAGGTLRAGRFQLKIRPQYMLGGFCHWSDGSLPPMQHALILAGGPLASLGLAILIWQLDTGLHPDLGRFDMLPQWAGIWALFMAGVTALPFRYPKWWGVYGGSTSDGYKIVRLFNANP